MIKFILKLLRLNGHEEIEAVKQSLLGEKQQAISDLKRINKRFKFIIDAQNIDLVIRDIDNIRNGK